MLQTISGPDVMAYTKSAYPDKSEKELSAIKRVKYEAGSWFSIFYQREVKLTGSIFP